MGIKDESDLFGKRVKVMFGVGSLLLAILFIIVMFHFYTRSRQRHERRRRREFVLQVSTQITPVGVISMAPPTSGLDPVIIASLPKLLYKNSEQFSKCDVVECSVCLGTIVEDATIRVLPNCKHLFHVDCIDKWFGSNTTCPICRTVAEPLVQQGHGQMGTVQVQPTAPAVEDALLIDADELEKVGGSDTSGLRIASSQVILSRARSARAFEDMERV